MRSTRGTWGSSSTLPPVCRWYQTRADLAVLEDSKVKVLSQSAGSGHPAFLQRAMYFAYWSNVLSLSTLVPWVRRSLTSPPRSTKSEPAGTRTPTTTRSTDEMAKIERRERGAPERREPVWEYATAPESSDIVRLEGRYGLFIGGEFVEPKSGRYFESINPATEEPLAEVAEAGPEDVDLAVNAAREAHEKHWRDLPGTERAKFIFRSARASSPSWSRWTVASPSRNRATSTCRSPRPTSSITRGGRTSSNTRSPIAVLTRSAWRGRASRGTSPSSWRRGRSRRPSRPATPSS